MLSQLELERRNQLIKEGVTDCRKLIGKQKSEEDYFFYEGSIDGFEECKNLNSLESYAERIQELYQKEDREIIRSLRRDDEETKFLKEHYQIYDDGEPDLDKVWKLKGIRTQIEFIYERLKVCRLLLNVSEKLKEGLNLEEILF